MLAYYDTGTLVPLFMEEVFSEGINTFVETRNEVIPIHLFHRLELENALMLKMFRGEIDDHHCQASIAKIASSMREGALVFRPVDWISAMEEARRIGAKTTARAGCRALDLLHVAIARLWQSEVFVTADERQLKAARGAGLETVDARALPQKNTPDIFTPSGPSDTVRKKRARYGTLKRSSAKRKSRKK